MWPYYLFNPFKMLLAWFRGKNFKINWPHFKGRRVIPLHLSRIGIALAYRILGLSVGDEVLVPSYNCGSEIDPLLCCGANTVFYRVDSDTMIDSEDIKSRVSPKTRAILVIHYFGWPQKLEELATWCQDRGIFLIEDCALSLFSEGPEGPIGSVGDAGVHCFWKTLPIPDGGALSLPKNNRKTIEKMRSPSWGSILERTVPFVKSWLRNQAEMYLGSVFLKLMNSYRSRRREIPGNLKKNGEMILPDLPPSYYFNEKIKNWTISRFSIGMMNQVDPKQVVQSRRRNYIFLHGVIHDLPGMRPLFDDLPEGVCPLVMPVLVADPIQWEISLNDKGVLPIRWWKGYHRDLSWEGFPEAQKLKNHLLAFHIDQYLSENQLAHIADSIKEVSLRRRDKSFKI